MAILILGSELMAQTRDPRGDRTVNYFSRYGRAELRLQKTLFNPAEPIKLRFRIQNRGYTTFRVYPSTIRNTSFQFLVTDRKNRSVPVRARRVKPRRERGTAVVDRTGTRIKEVILHPGESFERTIHLRDLYRLEPGREYRIVGYFYPDPRRTYFVRTVNTLRLRIDRKRRQLRPRYRDDFHHDSLPGLSPEETVYLFLSAERRRNWQNYLKFLDIRKFINSYDRFASRYVAASRAERPAILRRFKRFLISGRAADKLKSFQITKKQFDRTAAGEIKDTGRSYVTAMVERATRGYTIVYRYKYTLERVRSRAGFWRIIHVSVSIVR